MGSVLSCPGQDVQGCRWDPRGEPSPPSQCPPTSRACPWWPPTSCSTCWRPSPRPGSSSLPPRTTTWSSSSWRSSTTSSSTSSMVRHRPEPLAWTRVGAGAGTRTGSGKGTFMSEGAQPSAPQVVQCACIEHPLCTKPHAGCRGSGGGQRGAHSWGWRHGGRLHPGGHPNRPPYSDEREVLSAVRGDTGARLPGVD